MTIRKKFKFGIFDVDGTIFDNMPLCADAFLMTIKNFTLPQKETRKIYLETNGMNLNDQFKLVFEKYKILHNKTLITKLNKEFFALRDNRKAWQNAPLFPGFKSLFKKLKRKRITLFISSGSNTNEIISRLKKTKIFAFFDLVLGAEKIPKGAKHISRFANFCGLSRQKFASQTFFISDGPNDMKLAQSAGLFSIGITNTVIANRLKAAGANKVIKKADELLNIIF